MPLLQGHLFARRHCSISWQQSHLEDQVILFQELLPFLKRAFSSAVQALLPPWRLHPQPCWNPTTFLVAKWKTRTHRAALWGDLSYWWKQGIGRKWPRRTRNNTEWANQSNRGNQSWSHRFVLTDIYHLISTTLTAFCTPSSASVKLCTPCWDWNIMAARKHLAHRACYWKITNNTLAKQNARYFFKLHLTVLMAFSS